MALNKSAKIAAIVFGVFVCALALAITLLLLERAPAPSSTPLASIASSASSSPSSPPALTVAYEARPIGDPLQGRPWIIHVSIVDLDGDSLPDVLACDAQSNSIRWLRQSPRGTFTERQIGGTIAAPARISTHDLSGSGRLDVLVASLGQVFPNNDKLGSVVVLENLGHGEFRQRTIIDQIARVADVRAADLDADGKPDLVVGEFGYDQGGVRWLRNLGHGQFESQVVNLQAGTIHTPIVDVDGTGSLDFLALVSQEFEEIHRFRNLGGGKFKDTIIWGSTNEDYGSSGLAVADVNGDRRPDLVYTNGDAFDYARPGPRSWHGMQWIENRGKDEFVFHRVGDFPGAYSPCAADLNGDGFVDLLAVSGFNDWSKPDAVSMMAWLNDGRQNFVPVALAQSPTHLVTAAIGDLDGDGIPEIVTGGFHAYPPFDRMSRLLVWKRK